MNIKSFFQLLSNIRNLKKMLLSNNRRRIYFYALFKEFKDKENNIGERNRDFLNESLLPPSVLLFSLVMK